MFRKFFLKFALKFAFAVRLFGLLAATALTGCYVYPAGYGPYAGYPAGGVYEGYPYYDYGGYEGGVYLGAGDYGHGRRVDDGRGFRGRPSGFNHPDVRPGGLGGAAHGGGSSHGGGGFFSHH